MIHIEYTEEFIGETRGAKILHTKRNKKATKLRAIYKQKGTYYATLFRLRENRVEIKTIAQSEDRNALIRVLLRCKNWRELVLD